MGGYAMMRKEQRMEVAARMSNQFSFIFIKQFHKNNISFYVLYRIVSMGGYAMM